MQRVCFYNARLAQKDADSKRRHYGCILILTVENKQKMENHLRLTWVSEMIAYKLNLVILIVYNYLNKGRLNFSLLDLSHRNVF